MYLAAVGLLGFAQAIGLDFVAQDGLPTVLGLRVNPAFATLSTVIGAVVAGGALLGGNLSRWINLAAAVALFVVGLAMMSLLRTDLNVLAFAMTTCIVFFILGLVFLAAGLYGQVGSAAQHRREERFRHGTGPDPEEHILGAENVPRAKTEPAPNRS